MRQENRYLTKPTASQGAEKERSLHAVAPGIDICPYQPERHTGLADLIRKSLANYDEVGSVLASSYRRVADLERSYLVEGSNYFVAQDNVLEDRIVGGAGLGPLHGLPTSEGIGEIRDIFVLPNYRNRGIGTKLLHRALLAASELEYKSVYLETTPDMRVARKLFERFGFEAVRERSQKGPPRTQDEATTMPCYYVLKDLGRLSWRLTAD